MGAARVLVLAGEESGDQHGAAVVEALKARAPALRFWGTGGARLAALGVERLAGLEDLAVMGFAEVVGRLGFFRRLEADVHRRLDQGEADLVLAVDYPGFNLRIARYARERGVPVLFYIAPQVWAWRAGRAARLAQDASRLAVILPFEVEIFARVGADVTFVGHPLLDHPPDIPDRAAFLGGLGLDPARPVLALFPGSRAQEISRHLVPFLEAARILRTEDPALQVVVARAPSLRDVVMPDDVVDTDQGRALLAHARAAVVKSGTSTLEAALAGTPFVCAYRTHPLTFAVARRVVRVEHVALANLVAGRRVVPELLQTQVTGPALADTLRPLLADGAARTEMQAALAGVRARLGTPGAAARVADMALELLGARVAQP